MVVQEYMTKDASSPFGRWFADLDPVAAAKITVAITRLAVGNVSNVKGVGAGVLEQKVDFGPGYRIYFGRDGERLIILLGGGTKRRQQADIERAAQCWADYRARKRNGD
jgi:putative addiction module killer protein